MVFTSQHVITSAPPTSTATPSTRSCTEQQFPKGYVGLDAVAAYLGLAASTVSRRLVPEGLPHVRAGRRYVFRLADVDVWMSERATAERAARVALLEAQWLAQGPPAPTPDQAHELALALVACDRSVRERQAAADARAAG